MSYISSELNWKGHFEEFVPPPQFQMLRRSSQQISTGWTSQHLHLLSATLWQFESKDCGHCHFGICPSLTVRTKSKTWPFSVSTERKVLGLLCRFLLIGYNVKEWWWKVQQICYREWSLHTCTVGSHVESVSDSLVTPKQTLHSATETSYQEKTLLFK